METHQLVKGLLSAGASDNEAHLIKLAVELLYSLGSALPVGDQEWLSANLQGLPSYLGSKEGGKVMTTVLLCYKGHVEKTQR